jgi:hypothetical protein
MTWSHFKNNMQLGNLIPEVELQNLKHLSGQYYQKATHWIDETHYSVIGNYPDVYHQVTSCKTVGDVLLVIMLFWLVDNLIVKRYLNNARWYSLHAMANALVVYYVSADLYNLLVNPIKSFSRTATYSALNITVALHFYHVVFFRNLTLIDWLHHVLMITIAIIAYFCPSSVVISTNGLLFFLNGLPGGIDYVMLVLVKYGIIRPIREKELNSYLNIWIRSPGILIGTHNLYLTIIYSNYKPYAITKLMAILILVWNAQYFTYRVIGNYFTKLTQKCIQFENREGRPMSPEYENKYLTDEDSVITEEDAVTETQNSAKEAEETTLSRLINNITYIESTV